MKERDRDGLGFTSSMLKENRNLDLMYEKQENNFIGRIDFDEDDRD
jgi:hypothetical protein